jgi:hypothetical protein
MGYSTHDQDLAINTPAINTPTGWPNDKTVHMSCWRWRVVVIDGEGNSIDPLEGMCVVAGAGAAAKGEPERATSH